MGTVAEGSKQLKGIGANRATAERGSEVFARVPPRLAVYSHHLLFGSSVPEDLLPATRKRYDGRSIVGDDLRQINIRTEILTRRIRCKT